MSDLVQHITDDQFQSIVAKGVTLVDFWAPWCGPCKMIAPILDELAGELQGKARIVKINVDDNPVIASQFSIMSIPTLGADVTALEIWMANQKYAKRKSIAEKIAEKTHSSAKRVMADTLPYFQEIFRKNKALGNLMAEELGLGEEEAEWLAKA